MRDRDMYPEFTIRLLCEDGNSVIGSLNRQDQGKEHWIDDNYVGAILCGDVVAFGRWFQESDDWRFLFDENESSKLQLSASQVVYALDGYWGERAEIVLDSGISWSKVKFTAKKEWDHEHCAICWAAISESENASHFLGAGHPVCEECFKRYVQPKSLDFVPGA
jgi:hypothetical protein